MPPLISLETSSLKYSGLSVRPEEGRTIGLEFITAARTDDSNVIQLCGSDFLRNETEEDNTGGVEPEYVPESRVSYFRQLFENSPSAIVLLDTYDHVIDLNPAFTKIFQYALEEIKNLPLTDFIVPKGHMREAIEMTLKTLRGESILETIQRKRKDGTLVDVELTAYPVTLQGARIGIYTIYTDVSQKNRLQQHVVWREELQSLGVLAGGVARDFNAVLGVLMAGVKQLMRGTPAAGPCAKTFQEMNTALDRGVELVSRLLSFAGEADVRTRAADGEMQLEELFAMLEEIVPEGFSMTCAGKPHEPCSVHRR